MNAQFTRLWLCVLMLSAADCSGFVSAQEITRVVIPTRTIQWELRRVDGKLTSSVQLGSDKAVDSKRDTTSNRENKSKELSKLQMLGFEKMRLKKYQEAIEAYLKVVQLDASADHVRGIMASAYLKLNEPKKALDQVDVAMRINPWEREYYISKARALADLSRFKEALSYADGVIQNEPSAESYNLRADIKEKMHNRQGLLSDLQLAILASERSGEDAMDELDRWEELTGSHGTRPQPDLAMSSVIVGKIGKLEASDLRFDPAFIQKILGVTLVETKIVNEPLQHSRRFHLASQNKSFEAISVGDDFDYAYHDGAVLSIKPNTDELTITLEQIKKTFGVPAKIVGDPISRVAYIRPWGQLVFSFQRHGFKSLERMAFLPNKADSS